MKHIVQWMAGATLLLSLVACHAPAADNTNHGSAPMELKIYAVPPAGAGDLASGLQAALGKQANVSLPSEGKLLVYAPRDAQASIEKAIATLGSAMTAPPAVSLILHVWIVDSEPGNGTDAPTLKALERTLDTLRKTTGPMHFQLAQSAAAMASSGNNHARTLAELLSPKRETNTITLSDGIYTQNIEFSFDHVSRDGVNLWLDYDDHGASGLKKIKTQIEAPFGQYIVLAQAPGICPPLVATNLTNGTARTTTCTDKPALRLLVVRVDRAHPNA